MEQKSRNSVRFGETNISKLSFDFITKGRFELLINTKRGNSMWNYQTGVRFPWFPIYFFIFFRTFRNYNWKQLDLTYFY